MSVEFFFYYTNKLSCYFYLDLVFKLRQVVMEYVRYIKLFRGSGWVSLVGRVGSFQWILIIEPMGRVESKDWWVRSGRIKVTTDNSASNSLLFFKHVKCAIL